jgi:RNA polymerase sigma-70 factor (ECF subfamily)
MSAEETYSACSACDAAPPAEGRERPGGAAAAADARLRSIVDRHYSFLWRTLRYLGVPDGATDDAAQQVLCILARRLSDVRPDAEMAFLFSTALRVASEARRESRRRPPMVAVNVDTCSAPATPEDLLDERRAHEVLREILEALPIDLRAIFILFEIEELTQVEIASLTGLAQGTVASRIRRAREKFRELVRRRSATLRIPRASEGR